MIDTSELVDICPKCKIFRAYCDSCGVEFCSNPNCELDNSSGHRNC